MPLRTTEMRRFDRNHIDELPAADASLVAIEAQVDAARAAAHAAAEIAQGAALMAQAIRDGGTLIYIAAGSSGLVGLGDAAELGGTFGIPAQQVKVHMAGGVPTDAKMPGGTEDEESAAIAAVSAASNRDVVIALSASGTTPYAISAASAAKSRGAKVIAIANNPNTPLLSLGDVAICLPTPPEVVAGSTRLGAATAQKIALNTMSTLMGVDLGHVYQGFMVNFIADNIKLRDRAARIVSEIAKVSHEAALDALSHVDGQVKLAILVAKGMTPDAAKNALAHSNNHIARALS